VHGRRWLEYAQANLESEYGRNIYCQIDIGRGKVVRSFLHALSMAEQATGECDRPKIRQAACNRRNIIGMNGRASHRTSYRFRELARVLQKKRLFARRSRFTVSSRIRQYARSYRPSVSSPNKSRSTRHHRGTAPYVHKRCNSGACGHRTRSTRGVAGSATLAPLATSFHS
jgi:hypothetical protein